MPPLSTSPHFDRDREEGGGKIVALSYNHCLNVNVWKVHTYVCRLAYAAMS